MCVYLTREINVRTIHPMPSPAPDTRNIALYRAIGERVARRRTELNLTQRQLAEETDGRLTRSAIANIESGRQRVAVHHLFDLADALKASPSTLLPEPSTIPAPPQRAAEQLRSRVLQRKGERLLEPKRTKEKS